MKSIDLNKTAIITMEMLGLTKRYQAQGWMFAATFIIGVIIGGLIL